MRPCHLDPARQLFVAPIQVLTPGRLPGLRKRLNAKVSGRVYVAFASSEQNQGMETGMQSVKLELLNASGALIAQTLTDHRGTTASTNFPQLVATPFACQGAVG